MKLKRLFILILSLCFLVFALSACNPKSNEGTIPSPPGQTTPNQSDEPTEPSKPDKQETPSEPSKPDEQETPTEPSKPDEQETPTEPSKPDEQETPSEPNKPDEQETKKVYSLSEDGKTVYFGSYPTEQITDESLVSALSALAGDPMGGWTSYDYYADGDVQDYMFYTDIERDSVKYRGVYFSSYRPFDTRNGSSKERSFQDENGYFTGITYWFEYETLSWRVLEKSNGIALIVSEKVLDSHEFFPASKGENGHKANDYQASSIRKFLNNDFYMAAFSAAEQTNIFADGDDFVFSLGYEEVTKTDYGFSSDNDRKLDATDYAKVQGLNTDGGARWWLSSSNDTYDFYARYVDGYGYPEYNQYVYWCCIGVVPALKIKLFDDEETTPSEDNEPNILIAYFSCTNTTEGIANYIKNITGGTLYEIVPEIPYTEADLAYYTGGRADKEQNDPTARPAISGKVEDMEEYDVIFLGYPIWHSGAPKIIYTFLESYDFSGKTIIPFCTSHSSGIGNSATNLHSLAEGATWLDGRRFSSGTSQSTVDEWVDSLGLKFAPNVYTPSEETSEITALDGNEKHDWY